MWWDNVRTACITPDICFCPCTRCKWCVALGFPVCSCRGWGNSLHRRTDHRRRAPQAVYHHPQLARSKLEYKQFTQPTKSTFSLGFAFNETCSYLNLALAIVHHAMLGCHGFVCVQGGGIKRHLFHFGYAANGEGFAGTCSLIFVSPVAEKLLEQSRLSSCRKYLDLQGLPEF